jgi:hypothetical protein
MVSGGVGVPGGTPLPPRAIPRGADFPSNYASGTVRLSWVSAAVLCAILGALCLVFILGLV